MIVFSEKGTNLKLYALNYIMVNLLNSLVHGNNHNSNDAHND